jgi:hypothetical protein
VTGISAEIVFRTSTYFVLLTFVFLGFFVSFLWLVPFAMIFPPHKDKMFSPASVRDRRALPRPPEVVRPRVPGYRFLWDYLRLQPGRLTIPNEKIPPPSMTQSYICPELVVAV